jgi:hypothetical protein
MNQIQRGNSVKGKEEKKKKKEKKAKKAGG